MPPIYLTLLSILALARSLPMLPSADPALLSYAPIANPLAPVPVAPVAPVPVAPVPADPVPADPVPTAPVLAAPVPAAPVPAAPLPAAPLPAAPLPVAPVLAASLAASMPVPPASLAATVVVDPVQDGIPLAGVPGLSVPATPVAPLVGVPGVSLATSPNAAIPPAQSIAPADAMIPAASIPTPGEMNVVEVPKVQNSPISHCTCIPISEFTTRSNLENKNEAIPVPVTSPVILPAIPALSNTGRKKRNAVALPTSSVFTALPAHPTSFQMTNPVAVSVDNAAGVTAASQSIQFSQHLGTMEKGTASMAEPCICPPGFQPEQSLLVEKIYSAVKTDSASPVVESCSSTVGTGAAPPVGVPAAAALPGAAVQPVLVPSPVGSVQTVPVAAPAAVISTIPVASLSIDGSNVPTAYNTAIVPPAVMPTISAASPVAAVSHHPVAAAASNLVSPSAGPLAAPVSTVLAISPASAAVPAVIA